MEQAILAATIQDRGAFDDVLVLNIEDDLTDQAQIVWKLIKEYYANDAEAEFVDTEILHSQIQRTYPKHAERLSKLLDECADDEVSVPNVVKEVFNLKLDRKSDQIASAMVGKKFEEAKALIEEFTKLLDNETLALKSDSRIMENVSAVELADRVKQDNLIYVLPKRLNDQIDDGVLRGHHIVVFAPTDMGKTLFAVNMSYGFLKQGLKVLYIGNEDPGEDILMRLYSRMTGMTSHEIRRHPDRADQLASDKGYSNFILVEADPGTEAEIRNYIEEYEPDVLIVDQIRNLNMNESNKVLQLEKAAQMMRNFGKQYDLVPVSFTQASDSATGKVFLQRGDIDYSNVGIPGTADVLIGIGADEEMESRGRRMLSLIKNKRGGNKEPIPCQFLHNYSKVV